LERPIRTGGPIPSPRGEEMISAAAATFARLTSAMTREDYRAGSADVTALYVQRLEEEIRLLKMQVSGLAGKCETLNNQFHTSDKDVAVLTTKLQEALSKLMNQYWLDWMINLFFALGGAIVGVGVSWPGINIGGRILVSILGVLIILVPGLYKSIKYLKTLTPE